MSRQKSVHGVGDRQCVDGTAPAPFRRSLKPLYVDLIRDGVATARMREQGRDRAIYNALVRTALAAVNAHWEYWEWHAELDGRSSNLGNQAATKRNGQNRPRDHLEKMLQKAWDSAVDVAAKSPAFDEGARAAHVGRFRTWLADPACPVSDNQRVVLDAIARRAAELNVTSTACPIRDLQAKTGLGLTALRTALRQCIDRGLLVQMEKGQPWAKGRKRENCRAAVYRLPRVEALPRVNQCPASGASGAPPTVPPPVRAASAPMASGAPPTVPPPVRAASAPMASGAPRSVCSTETVPGPLASGAPLSSIRPLEEQVTLNELVQAHALITQIKVEVLAALRVELGLPAPDRAGTTIRPLRVVHGDGGA